MALQQIIDRRLQGKNKSVGNRERFLRRHKDQIREAVRKAINGRGIRDIEQGEDITLPKRDVSEPVFQHGSGGKRELVHPGNREYVAGDRIERPQGGAGQGSGGGQASDSGEGEDDFVFHLSREEFMEVFFEDLALPNLVKTQLAEVPEYKMQRAGLTSDGTPNNLHVLRSMRGAIGRRIAIGAEARRELRHLEAQLAHLQHHVRGDADLDPGREMRQREIKELEARIVLLRERVARIPYLDPIDLRYRSRVRVPVPTTKAVMFCLMDVSGSMDEARKDLAKRFYILLYLFLTRHYDHIDLVFIRHHTQAQEVNEQEFFHATETGGTVVSSALVLMKEIVDARYPTSEWNIYAAQASDGDNWHHDSGRCREMVEQQLLPLVRYFAYVQVAEAEQNLWEEYAQIAAAHRHFAMRKVLEPSQIYPVFRELFRKEGAPTAEAA
ncbi:YeaH/YhbH family protein [Rivibacter subsaxonicus]|uniref:UPF0229 protein EV670_1562 n=1 Tax=Rivibacter subsaxonicus TaxID=457575 RepID=A0A4Q7VX16_9BURK|nr:YeaH/YhbH family protein [Rivibacter subsaxonicus]RZU00849.1 hypothetical protein EV670_1562 [Rivibacter subsaxonicus]